MVDYPRGQSPKRPTQGNLFTKRQSQVKPPRRPEKAIQAGAVRVLKDCGYTVLELGQIKKVARCLTRDCARYLQTALCPGCRKPLFSPEAQNTVGTPDAEVWHPDWPIKGVVACLEFKGEGTEVRKRQAEFAAGGLSVLCYSEEQAARAVLDLERSMGVQPNDRLTRWLRMQAKGVWHVDETASGTPG